MSSFDMYAEEFSQLLHQQSSCSDNSNAAAADVGTNDNIHNTVPQQCQELLQLMAVEARNNNNIEEKKRYMERYGLYKEQYRLFKQQIERQSLLQQRQQPMNNTATTTPAADKSTQLLRNTIQGNDSTVLNQNSILQQSLQSIHGTEQIAMDTIEELHNQRSTLNHTNQLTQSITSMTQRANIITTNLLKPWWKKGL